ncbi:MULTISPECIES: GAF domain-containing protein [unclassified Paenibacillus]|uniref:GAF domain-containing protein n=1 Tax=unclassified Paenibacillus TaxID=185978 RepID=UPI0024071A15|nr:MULTISPECIES: GAF domain-containing protein [unclassified Paenibacillus]MDF9844514.1 sugar diacid utilization regulator [Paenibacillus sp. PastF-2]MDF9851118.1 sugar diacid utilization regulator [Paenibacillus sp. PastM-2]MDF9857690.1 sugar diacid utilization regulator [Paenibacillus sp. PastF-1]MDH6482956.1 sugar diacid utilization regulator [Paenibacillus sp. PastH-2]MDH6510381.1 sugar diacid utilization regulator [Paenibacillus sp. PastM-3]
MLESTEESSVSELQRRLTQNELLIDAAQYLTSSLTLDDVITRILDRALNVIEAADAGVLFIYDKQLDRLKPMACSGFVWDKMKNVILQPGESMTGITLKSRTPQIFHNFETVRRNTDLMSPSNKISYEESLQPIIQSAGEQFKIQSVMCAPLLIRGECIGVMTIDNFTRGSFTDNDLSLLITLSNLAAIALENARLYEEEKSKKEKLEELNGVIQFQNRQLNRINMTHERLMNLILSGKSTPDFGTAVYNMLERPVILYDSLLNVLTDHPQAHFGFDIDTPPFIEEFQQVLKTWEPCRVQPDKSGVSAPFMLFPILTSNAIFGVLAVSESGSLLSEQDIVLAEQCCLVLAMELMKREAVYETEQRVKGEFLDELMSEKNAGTLRERAKTLGLNADDSFVFMIADVDFSASSLQGDQLKTAQRHVQNTIETELMNINPYSLAICKLNAFVIILALPKEIDHGAALKRSRSTAAQIHQRLLKLHQGIRCSIGIGRVCRHFEGFMQSYQDAKQSVAYSKRKKEINIIKDYVEMGAAQFILDQPQAHLLEFVYGLLQPLLDYPSPKRAELLKALDAYILCGKRHKEASHLLDIHPNTFAYRMKRIEEILDLQLDQYSVFFDLQFAWQVLDMFDLKNQLLERT